MRKFKLLSIALLSAFSFQAFANSDIAAHSLIQCTEATTIAQAVDMLNEHVAPSKSVYTSPRSGIVFEMGDHVTSQPIITTLRNGNYSVCVTLNRKN